MQFPDKVRERFKMECNSISELLNFIESCGMGKKLYVVGAGNYGKLLGKYLNNMNIIWEGYVDRSPQYAITDQKRVITYEDIVKKGTVFIISSVIHKREIQKSLIEKGIREKDIVSFASGEAIWEVFSQSVADYKYYSERIKAFKGVYSGKRCFIIGNGPSLKISDLERLKKEVTFASNSIYRLYPYTEWRPTFYTAIDSMFCDKELADKESICKVISDCKGAFFSMMKEMFQYRDDKDMEKVHYCRIVTNEIGKGEMLFSQDCSDKVYNAGTVTFVMLQLAMYMGFREIYLLGVDSCYSVERHIDGSITENEVVNHQEIIEEGDRKYEDIMNEKYGALAEIDVQISGYKVARKYAERCGVYIYNATRGGKLEVFQRIDFDKVLEEI